MIKIVYTGKYPTLCHGHLTVIVDGLEWDFGDGVLSTGGSVWFDDDWNAHVEEGNWSVRRWPEQFPEHLKEKVLEAINEQVEKGCCGGCI